MGKLKEQLAGVAALIAAIVAIGGGFVKYGEITTKLTEIESRSVKDYSADIAVLEEKVDSLSSEHGHTKILVNEKEIELLKLDIQELKEKSKNPLAN
jgi:hypothetical protein|tara:strand:+ start:186 stop:476 length:291 start_codon:yes stop_codon:yes gene_type:complete